MSLFDIFKSGIKISYINCMKRNQEKGEMHIGTCSNY